MIDWEKAQEIAKLLEVVTPEARRDALSVLLKSEKFRLPRAVPSDQLFDLNKLAEFIRLHSRSLET